MPDEEFDVLGEDELALLTRRFERLHENQVNMRRNTRTCFQCGKPGHFVTRAGEDEGDRHKSRKLSNNLSGLSCFARDGFCTMALSFGSKKTTQSDSDSDSDDEVRDELPFLRQENERLGLLLDNHDDMLREAKKMRKELRASLEDARTRVAELETQNMDAKLEIDSLKASPVVSD
jgi:hypothetical protein